MLMEYCDKAIHLNEQSQEFIHATFAVTEEGSYVRFRKLVGYSDLVKEVLTTARKKDERICSSGRDKQERPQR